MAGVEVGDPTIKLFGKTIALPLNHAASAIDPSATSHHHDADSACKFVSSEFSVPKHDSDGSRETQKEISADELASGKQVDGNANQTTDQTTSEISENPSEERETSSPKTSKNEEQSETSISPDKTLKKPDKILPCPRCNSMNTKFCYYNNYNVNQPRHFCKNCQRYWTAGGTMRNVPVGAGRRKNKNLSSQFRHLMVPDNGVRHHHHYLGNNGTFLTFGSDSPISDSIPSISHKCKPNGFHVSADNGDDHSSKSSISASYSSEKAVKTSLIQQPAVKNFLPFPPQLHSFPGLPWPYSSNPPMGPPPFCPPACPVPYFPAPPYWGCTPPPSLFPNNQNPLTSCSVLGKHSRDGKIINSAAISEVEELVKQKSSETCLWVPKTLKMDDPNEAAKSSIWSALGIRNEKASSINGGGLFAAAFQSKGKEETTSDSCSLLQANPAAFSRAIQFREIA